ncbi:MAG TPA: choice-of-anchor J domain-containing protein, partial [Flavobacterium sp.]|nr:choice-of-anchor J domain-containing protein [Flavobacterium sp.]
MKKLLLLSMVFSALSVTAQTNVYSFGFDGTTATMEAAGWMRTNQSTPATATMWTIASYTPVVVGGTQTPLPFTDVNTPSGQTSNPPNGQAGGPNSFALVNFTSTTGAGTISNWLITPVITVENGDVVSFYTRIGKNNATQASYADNLQFRMSTNGAATVNPTGGSAGLGDFTTLLAEVNPSLNLTSYPMSWPTGLISTTISGLTGPTPVKFAFRYFVPNGGPTGDNSDIIGIDTFIVERPLSTDTFFRNNLAMYPNPANEVLNLNSQSA